jgi:hypothetical protein
MRLGIMQPYFLPYLGYWQLLNAVDSYVIYDDVNFIKGGWINRNRILLNEKPQYINIQMSGASSFKKINEIGVNPEISWREKLEKTINLAYCKAPYYRQTIPLVKETLYCTDKNLGAYIAHSIQVVCKHLDIRTKLLLSSELQENRGLHGQDRVLDICSGLGATEYYNAIGGRELYSFDAFAAQHICLHFLKSNLPTYPQQVERFTPGLSILDILMNCGIEQTKVMMTQYTLDNPE